MRVTLKAFLEKLSFGKPALIEKLPRLGQEAQGRSANFLLIILYAEREKATIAHSQGAKYCRDLRALQQKRDFIEQH
jgi:hypothetical protein